jgi:hypothetical protein
MSAVTIEVTAEDIARGQKFYCSNCPVALAASRALGHPVVAGANVMYVRVGGYPTLELPPVAKSFIEDFDSGENVSPFSFTLEWPS